MNQKAWLLGSVVAGVFITSLCAASAATPVSDFYKGKTVRIVVAYGEGGSYGLYARLLSQYMPKYVPGHPNFIVQYMPGGAGVRAANYMFNVAPRNGTYLAMLSDYVAITQKLRPKSVMYDAAKFSYVGSVTTVNYAVMAWHDSPVKTIEEAKTRTSIFGATGKASENYTTGAILNAVLGTKFKLVAGYKGSSALSLALERGEIQVQVSAWMSWKARKASWLKSKKIIPLVQIGLRKDPELANVPLVLDLAKNDTDKRILRFTSSSAMVGRALSGPPDLPADRLEALRKAFDAVVKDKGFLAAAEKARLDVKPITGQELEAIIKQAINAPPAIVKRVREAIQNAG